MTPLNKKKNSCEIQGDSHEMAVIVDCDGRLMIKTFNDNILKQSTITAISWLSPWISQLFHTLFFLKEPLTASSF